MLVLSASNNIGAPLSGAGNQISGNAGNGVYILGPSATGIQVANNVIGGALGTSLPPNGGDGVLIENAPGNIIGGTVSNAGNVIAGNTGDGINIENYQGAGGLPTVPGAVGNIVNEVNAAGDNATANRAQGNTIGFNVQARPSSRRPIATAFSSPRPRTRSAAQSQRPPTSLSATPATASRFRPTC